MKLRTQIVSLNQQSRIQRLFIYCRTVNDKQKHRRQKSWIRPRRNPELLRRQSGPKPWAEPDDDDISKVTPRRKQANGLSREISSEKWSATSVE